jgi:F-box protein 18 (helicase)
MQNIEELEEYIEKTEDAQLGMIVEVVQKYGDKLPEYISVIKRNHIETDDKNNAEMIFSTVHKCKGMEYDEITLMDDFVSENKIKNLIEKYGIKKLNINHLNEEINLLYVAVTRTKNRLNIPFDLLPSSSIKTIVASPELALNPLLKENINSN